MAKPNLGYTARQRFTLLGNDSQLLDDRSRCSATVHNCSATYHGGQTMCRVHKPGVPRGLASTPGLGPRKQHVIHGPAQESKTQRAGRTVRSPTKRSTQKNKRPLINFFGPPLRPEHSLRAPAASERSLQSEGLAQNAASYSDPASPTGDP